MTPDDLLEAATAGDLAAFSQLCAILLPDLRRVADAHATPPISPDDAVQDVMLSFVDTFPRSSFVSVGQLKVFLRLVLRRRIADQARKVGRRRERTLTGVDRAEPTPESLAEPDTDIPALLSNLPDREAEAVRRIFLDGQTVAQAAREIGIEQGSVRKAMARGLAKLRLLLGD